MSCGDDLCPCDLAVLCKKCGRRLCHHSGCTENHHAVVEGHYTYEGGNYCVACWIEFESSIKWKKEQ